MMLSSSISEMLISLYCCMIVFAACGIALTVQKSKTDGYPGYTFSGGGVITGRSNESCRTTGIRL